MKTASHQTPPWPVLPPRGATISTPWADYVGERLTALDPSKYDDEKRWSQDVSAFLNELQQPHENTIPPESALVDWLT